MSIFRIVLREIVYRKLGFLVGVFAVAVAVGCVLGQIAILDEDERRTEAILEEKQQEYKTVLAELEKEVRVITKNMGFNLIIFHKDAEVSDFLAKGYIDKYLPESHVDRLAEAPLKSINHLLPVLQTRITLPESDVEITVKGTVGEVPILAQDKKKPLQEKVPRGKIIIGNALRRLLKSNAEPDPLAPGKPAPLIPGDEVRLLGRTFTVYKVQPKKVGPEDLTAWIHLKDAQEILDKQGLINVLYALNCHCEADHMDVVRQEIQGVLPDTQVEFESKAVARAETLAQAARARAAILESTKQERIDLRAQKETFLAIFLPLITLAALVLLGFLAWSNVRERRGEMGLYRALGWRSGQIFFLVLARALLAGMIGALFGLLASLAAGRMLGGDYSWLESHALAVGIILAGTPLASLVAAWVPAFLAVRQDPAVILQQEMT